MKFYRMLEEDENDGMDKWNTNKRDGFLDVVSSATSGRQNL